MRIFTLLFIALVSSPAFASDVCTITHFYKDASYMMMSACTNPADTKVLTRNVNGGVDAQMVVIAEMKSEMVKTLLDAGYRSVDGTSFAK